MYWSRNIQEAAEEAYRKKGEVGMSETQNRLKRWTDYELLVLVREFADQVSKKEPCDSTLWKLAIRIYDQVEAALAASASTATRQHCTPEEFYDKYFDPKVKAGKKGLEAMFLFAQAYASATDGWQLAHDPEIGPSCMAGASSLDTGKGE